MCGILCIFILSAVSYVYEYKYDNICKNNGYEEKYQIQKWLQE